MIFQSKYIHLIFRTRADSAISIDLDTEGDEVTIIFPTNYHQNEHQIYLGFLALSMVSSEILLAWFRMLHFEIMSSKSLASVDCIEDNNRHASPRWSLT